MMRDKTLYDKLPEMLNTSSGGKTALARHHRSASAALSKMEKALVKLWLPICTFMRSFALTSRARGTFRFHLILRYRPVMRGTIRTKFLD